MVAGGQRRSADGGAAIDQTNVPSGVAPSMKVTEPVGVPPASGDGRRKGDRLIERGGFSDEVSVTGVPTVSLKTAEALAA
jgi:hypothetical protein